MTARYLRHLIVWPIAATTLFVCGGALADDKNPVAIEQRLKALESSPKQKQLIAEPAARARKALRRVVDAQVAGDAAHAVELTALADDWATLAANVTRAVAIEKELAKLQDELTEVEQKRRRTETLLEATVAQRERTREELKRLQAEKTKPERAPSGPLDPKAKKLSGSKPSSAAVTPAAQTPVATSTTTAVTPGAKGVPTSTTDIPSPPAASASAGAKPAAANTLSPPAASASVGAKPAAAKSRKASDPSGAKP